MQAGNRARPLGQPWWQVPAAVVWQPVSSWEEASGADQWGRKCVHRSPGSGTLPSWMDLGTGEKCSPECNKTDARSGDCTDLTRHQGWDGGLMLAHLGDPLWGSTGAVRSLCSIVHSACMD